MGASGAPEEAAPVIKRDVITKLLLLSFLSLFSGFVPRVSWISLGGFVFLGAYEQSRHLLLHMTVR